jgi:hypothetical protein
MRGFDSYRAHHLFKEPAMQNCSIGAWLGIAIQVSCAASIFPMLVVRQQVPLDTSHMVMNWESTTTGAGMEQ